MKGGSILGQGADACVFYKPVECELKVLEDASRRQSEQVSKVLPLVKGNSEYKIENAIKVRIQELEPRDKEYAQKHVIVHNLICKPKFKPSDFQPVESIPKCKAIEKSLRKVCPSCEGVSPEVAKQISTEQVALQTPKYLASLAALLSGQAKLGSMKSIFDKSRSAWIEVVVYDTMRTCLVLNPESKELSMLPRFVHQDMHLGNVAVTQDLRGAMADFGRSVFIEYGEPDEFVKQLQKAAFQNNVLREDLSILQIYNQTDKFVQFTSIWAQIMQSVACLKVRDAPFFLSKDYKQWSHPKTPLMLEQEVLYRAAFIDKTDNGPFVWRDFIWIHVLPFVDLFGLYNTMKYASKLPTSIPFSFSPMMKQISVEFNMGTLSQTRALEVVTNAQARALGTAHGKSGMQLKHEFIPGSDTEKLQEIIFRANE